MYSERDTRPAARPPFFARPGHRPGQPSTAPLGGGFTPTRGRGLSSTLAKGIDQ